MGRLLGRSVSGLISLLSPPAFASTYPRNGFRTPKMTVDDDTRPKHPTDTDLFEPSPSTGYRGVFAVMGATPGLGDPEPEDAGEPSTASRRPRADTGADVLEVST